jgi:hypothetical protein
LRDLATLRNLARKRQTLDNQQKAESERGNHAAPQKDDETQQCKPREEKDEVMIEEAAHVPFMVRKPDLERDTSLRDEKTIESLGSAQTGRALRNEKESEKEGGRTTPAETGRYSAGIMEPLSISIPIDRTCQ